MTTSTSLPAAALNPVPGLDAHSSVDTTERLVQAGDTAAKLVRFSERDIAAFATTCGDWNPLHFDDSAAQASRFGEKIASGAHTSALLMGLATSYFSRSNDGIEREVVALNFNFAFKAPVYVDDDVTLRWTVQQREWNVKLNGWVVQADGVASSDRSGNALIARATLLVKAATR